jgi:hypothetical protein
MRERGFQDILTQRDMLILFLHLPLRLTRNAQERFPRMTRFPFELSAVNYEINWSLMLDIYRIIIKPIYMMIIHPHVLNRTRIARQYFDQFYREEIYPRYLSVRYLSIGSVPSPYQLLYGTRHGPINKATDLPAWPQDEQLKLRQLTIVDEYHCTAMHYAVMYGEDSLILAISQAGADLHVRNVDGESPLEMLFKQKRYPLLLVVLDHRREDRTLFSLTVGQFFTLFSQLLLPRRTLPVLDPNLPTDTRIDMLSNDAFDLFTDTLSDSMKDFATAYREEAILNRLRDVWMLSLQVSKQPMTKAIFSQCVKYYRQQETFFNRFLTIFDEPDFLKLLFVYEKKMLPEERLSLMQQAIFYKAIAEYCKTVKERGNVVVSNPERVMHRILLALIPYFKRIGYETDDLLPEAFSDRIGPLYKSIAEIPSSRLHFIYERGESSSGRKPVDLDDILIQLEKSLIFQNPNTLDPLTEEEMREVLKNPIAQQFLTDLHFKNRKEHTYVSPFIINELKELGIKLMNNSGGAFNEARATSDLQEYLNKMIPYEKDIAILNKIKVYVEIRREKTCYSDIFDRRQYDGCTQFLGPSIQQYVAAIENTASINFGESPLSKYFKFMPEGKEEAVTIIPPDEDLDGRSMGRHARFLAMQ